MVVKNTVLNGIDFESGTALPSVDLNDTFNSALIQHLGSDQVVGSVTNSTVEEEIGEVQIPANRVGTAVLVTATGKFRTALADNSTIKLYGGENTSGTTNTEFKAITRVMNTAAVHLEIGWVLEYWITGLDWTNTNYINITGKNSNADTNTKTTCESVVVLGK